MTITLVPRWTEQMFRPTGGQDHLGLGSVVTDRILPSLAPGINVLTPHPRYWSFYAFVVDEFWRRDDLPKTKASLRAYLRRKEAIFSAAGHHCTAASHDLAPIGSRRVAPLVASGPSKYSAAFDYMKSTGGGYGLYYATVMQATGVVRLADHSLGLPVDTVTPTNGREVAEAYREAISNTRYWKRYFDADEVPADVVTEYGNVACLCRLPESPDREPLVDVFLHGGHSSEQEARRTTLRLILELAEQTRKVGLTQDDFRRLLMYGATYDPVTDEETATFHPPEHLVSASRRWRLSQLRELFNWSLNGLWRWLADWGTAQLGDSFPVPQRDLDAALKKTALRSIPGVHVRLSDPIGDLIDACRNAAAVTDSLDGRWELWTELSEDYLLSQLMSHELASAEELAHLLVLYVTCLARLWDRDLPIEIGTEDWKPVREGGLARISLQSALDRLRADEAAGTTIIDVLRRVAVDQVIRQHERVALAKLPEDTFRFRREGAKIRFFAQPTEFQRNDSRFNALSSTCAELGWCGRLIYPDHRPTPEGQELRKYGDLGSGGSR